MPPLLLNRPLSSPFLFFVVFQPITEGSIFKSFRSLCTRKASSLDAFPFSIYECADDFSAPLCFFFNLSLSFGVFPSKWKVALVQPVWKQKGERCDPLSCRPIALLPSVSKVLEQLVLCQLLDSSLANNCIPDQQYGYLHDLSTVWQLLSVIEKLQCTLDVSRCIHAFSWPAMRVISLGIRTVPVLSVAKKLAAPRPTPTAPAAKCGLIKQDEAD